MTMIFPRIEWNKPPSIIKRVANFIAANLRLGLIFLGNSDFLMRLQKHGGCVDFERKSEWDTNFLVAKTRSLWPCCISDVSEVWHVFTPIDKEIYGKYKEIYGNYKEIYGNYETKQMSLQTLETKKNWKGAGGH